MTDINSAIRQRLAAVESSSDARILYACESGSRAWGFPSRDSDYDVRFIYVRPRDWYLRIDLDRQRDVIELPIEDEFDINGWDLKKALQLLRKSNPALLEWLDSPFVYQQDETFVSAIKALAPQYYSPSACHYHYSHMARGNYRDYLRGERVRIKKYFYVLRPLLAMRWIEQGRGVVPMSFESLLEVLDDAALRRDIETLVARKRQGLEAEYGPRIDTISRFIEQELARQEDISGKLPRPAAPCEPLNRLFVETLGVEA